MEKKENKDIKLNILVFGWNPEFKRIYEEELKIFPKNFLIFKDL